MAQLPAQSLSIKHVLFVAAVHIGAVAALAFPSWNNALVAFAIYVASGFGITVGYHRLFSHRAFEVPRWLERCFATLGALALQGGPMRWVADHRQHHYHSDGEGDPHDIKRGLFFAHIGWLFFLYPDDYDNERINKHAKDLARDPYYVWLERNAFLPGFLLGGILFLVGGLELFLWAFCLRLTCLYHSTWLVNSACHKWGYKSFQSATGTNNWLVGILALGEGWHNNHHAWPASAKQGLRLWEVDASWYLICTLKAFGLASNVRKVKPDADLPNGGAMVKSP